MGADQEFSVVVDPTDQICLDFMHFFAQQYVQESSQPINVKSCKYSQIFNFGWEYLMRTLPTCTLEDRS